MNGTIGNGLLLLGAVLFIAAAVNAIRIGRRARSAAYYSLRESALSKTRTWTLIAAAILAATVAWAIYLSSRPEPQSAAQAPTPVPAIAIATPSRMLPTSTPTVIPPSPPTPTATPAGTSSGTATGSPQPVVFTATPLPPTSTPPADLPDLVRTAPAGAVSPAVGAQLTFTTLASKVDSKGSPVDPGLSFPAGTRSVRLFFQATKVNNGAPWAVLCYKDDELVDSIVSLWKWGVRQQTARAFCAIDGSSGSYRIETYLGPYKQFEVGFELEAATPTPRP